MAIAYTPSNATHHRADKLASVLGVECRSSETPTKEHGKSGGPHCGIWASPGITVPRNGQRARRRRALRGSVQHRDRLDGIGRRSTAHQVQPLSGELDTAPFGQASFFEVTTLPSPLRDPRFGMIPSLFRLSNPRRIRAERSVSASELLHVHDAVRQRAVRRAASLREQHPGLRSRPSEEFTTGSARDIATSKLTPRGTEFLGTLMQQGMMVDLAAHVGRDGSNLLRRVLPSTGAISIRSPSHTLISRHLPYRGDYSDESGASWTAPAGTCETTHR